MLALMDHAESRRAAVEIWQFSSAVTTARRAAAALLMSVSALAAVGCQKAGNAADQPSSAVPAASASPTAALGAPPVLNESCMVDENAAIQDRDQVNTTDEATGKPMIKVGAAIEPTTKVVPLAELLAKPDEFAGRAVRVEGKVTAMCTHRRAWFAVGEVGGGASLRIVTAPGFLVPPNSIGLTGRAEGTVEIRELGEQARTHQRESHGLRDSGNRVVLLRAKGAEFL